MSIETFEKRYTANDTALTSEHGSKKYTILLISQNTLDIFLINKLLSRVGEYKVYEAGNLQAALKVVSYLSVDMMIVDDKVGSIDGYEVVKRLSRNQALADIPKMMLLTQDYKEALFENANFDNLDFIKKPIDGMIFKTRIQAALHNRQAKFLGGSIFENMIDAKISEAKEFLKIYKSFLDIDQNLLFVYDRKSNQVVESNVHFTKFFGADARFNKILANPRLFSKFVPKLPDPNYLNSHHVGTWLDLMGSVRDFNFIIALEHRAKRYSFSVMTHQLNLLNKEMYIIKLSNHNVYLPGVRKEKRGTNQKITSYLYALQNNLKEIEDVKTKEKINAVLKGMLGEMGISTALFSHESVFNSSEVNVHFIVAKILKSQRNMRATLNAHHVNEHFEENREFIFMHHSADALHNAIKGILESYHEAKVPRVDIQIFEVENDLKIEIVMEKDDPSEKRVIKKLFKKEESFLNALDVRQLVIPKHVELALNALGAQIKTYANRQQNIFMITVPKT